MPTCTTKITWSASVKRCKPVEQSESFRVDTLTQHRSPSCQTVGRLLAKLRSKPTSAELDMGDFVPLPNNQFQTKPEQPVGFPVEVSSVINAMVDQLDTISLGAGGSVECSIKACSIGTHICWVRDGRSVLKITIQIKEAAPDGNIRANLTYEANNGAAQTELDRIRDAYCHDKLIVSVDFSNVGPDDYAHIFPYAPAVVPGDDSAVILIKGDGKTTHTLILLDFITGR